MSTEFVLLISVQKQWVSKCKPFRHQILGMVDFVKFRLVKFHLGV